MTIEDVRADLMEAVDEARELVVCLNRAGLSTETYSNDTGRRIFGLDKLVSLA